jgi:hypothetical protein
LRAEPVNWLTATFCGFCTDTFRFLTELAKQNTRDWMTNQRERYHFVLREPLVELCDAVAERYVRPVLNRDHDWNLECEPRTGKALTSICKNDFGRSGTYHTVQWLTFYRRCRGSKRADAQFFVRVAAGGVAFGVHLGRSAKEAGQLFRENIHQHAEALAQCVPFGEFQFWTADDFSTQKLVRSPAELREWANGKSLAVGKWLPADSPLLRSDELVGEVMLAFDRLVPLFACATGTVAGVLPAPVLPPSVPPQSDAFGESLLSPEWLERVQGLLRLKPQMVLQGVPGTGKTHVAQHLARLITGNRPDRVRLVQFHPAYSYEEFVEGIRAISGEGGVSYPVVNGVLGDFAQQAAAQPGEAHVLVIDEFNRGNIPRIFGELLFLLEYRNQAATLPYSKRPFRLPENLLILATMNTADRSTVALDQAIRRRFSFVDMLPDGELLARWLSLHPPDDPSLSPRVVRAFTELNRRLLREGGPERQIGHSFFMVPSLDMPKLRAVWEHHIRPALADMPGGKDYRFEKFLS